MSDEDAIDFEELSEQKIQQISQRLDAASRRGFDALQHQLSSLKIDALFKCAIRLLKTEPTVLDLSFSDPSSTVTVVGDTHGQYHDVLRMFEVAGIPNQQTTFILNGDFVDRGSWGLETLILFVCWKVLMPNNVYLIRGNHESRQLTNLYGYKTELEAKYSRVHSRKIYSTSLELFAAMPLAAVVQEKTLVFHGGLFRAAKKRGGRRRKMAKVPLAIGDLSMLRACSKGGLEPTNRKVAKLITDVLWSDPVPENGVSENDSRGLGLVFGPDVTDAFLRANGLKLIIRSHEGPDARLFRSDMSDMMTGYAVDHDVEHGKLVTIFSAPDYPQFQNSDDRTENAAAVIILSYPNYTEPTTVHFNAVLPRPVAPIYYDLEVNAETDVEMSDVCSGFNEGDEEKSDDGKAETDEKIEDGKQPEDKIDVVLSEQQSDTL